MSKRRGRYTPEYRERLVELARGGRSPGVRAVGADDPELGAAGGRGRGAPERPNDDGGA